MEVGRENLKTLYLVSKLATFIRVSVLQRQQNRNWRALTKHIYFSTSSNKNKIKSSLVF